MKLLALSLTLLASAQVAFANVTPPSETQSRALQQAKRVASMENGHDLPSRAVVLGQRAAKNSERLELSAKKTARKSHKKPKASELN